MGYYVELTPEQKEQRRIEKELLTKKLLKQRKIVTIFFWIAAGLFIASVIATIGLCWYNNIFFSKTTDYYARQPLSSVVLIFVLFFTLSGFDLGFNWKINCFGEETIIPVTTLDHEWVTKVLADPFGVIKFLPQLINGVFLVTLVAMLVLATIRRKINTQL